jgi:hypothetical protein
MVAGPSANQINPPSDNLGWWWWWSVVYTRLSSALLLLISVCQMPVCALTHRLARLRSAIQQINACVATQKHTHTHTHTYIYMKHLNDPFCLAVYPLVVSRTHGPLLLLLRRHARTHTHTHTHTCTQTHTLIHIHINTQARTALLLFKRPVARSISSTTRYSTAWSRTQGACACWVVGGDRSSVFYEWVGGKGGAAGSG